MYKESTSAVCVTNSLYNFSKVTTGRKNKVKGKFYIKKSFLN